MRKSSAPSQRKLFRTPVFGNASSISTSSSLEKYKYIGKVVAENDENKTEQNVKSCSGGGKMPQERTILKSTDLVLQPSSLRIFNAVYGKQSKKKHKTWEGDGTVEVSSKNVTLKDSDGKIIGQSTLRKNEELEEGSRLLIGSKEVEILDLIVSNCEGKKRCLEEEENSVAKQCKNVASIKKTKLSDLTENKDSCTSSLANGNPAKIPLNNKKFKIPSVTTMSEPLVMPRPSEEHQWQYNEQHLPVTEVQVDHYLVKQLRQHQREGVSFLYSCVTGLRSPEYTGAILADEMGLGKTLQCITLIWTLLNQGFYGGKPIVKRVLIVVPSSLVKNWHNEFIRWIGSFRIKVFAVNKDNKIQNYSKSPFVPVVIISYEMFVKNHSYVKDIDFDLIVCDEGHRLKNSSIQATALLNSLECKRRILVTGTPLQNDLQEFYTLANFVNPGVLGAYPEFRKKFAKVIEASREPEADEDVVALGDQISKQLLNITNSFILRRTQSVINSYLPPKYEHVIFCQMSPLQRKLYTKLTDYCIQKCDNLLPGCEQFDHLSAITLLKKICNHPTLAMDKFFEESLVEEVKSLTSRADGFVGTSVKLKILQSLMDSLRKTKEKIILVSNFTQTLDVLERFCQLRSSTYSRFDGTTPLPLRNSIVTNFNSPYSNTEVLLLSSKAGGVGLNLVGASRLVLFDSDWNPATDLQAMARIWRDGQKRNVFIYRLLTSGSIEEKIFQRQLKKAGLSESVVDPLAVSAVKLSTQELKDLFEFEESNNNCITHNSLGCKCDGSGSVPGLPQERNSDIDEDLDWDLFDEEMSTFSTDEGEQVEDSVKTEESGNDLNEDQRDCELSFSSKGDEVKPKALRMNQLFLWEHHAPTVPQPILEEMGLDVEVASLISYLFRNKTI